MVESADKYELNKRVRQNDGTWQCWWLSLLEVARASGKLHHTFNDADGTLNKYFNGKIPAEGELPPAIKAKNDKLKNQKPPSKNALGEMNEVYGPVWQRMVMYFLWDRTGGTGWYPASLNINTEFRPDALKKILESLGVTGIVLPSKGAKITPTEVSKTIEGLSAGQWVLLDKEGHAMSGFVERVQPDLKKKVYYNQINGYNQSTRREFTCRVIKDKNDLGNLVTSGGTKINWLLPLTIS